MKRWLLLLFCFVTVSIQAEGSFAAQQKRSTQRFIENIDTYLIEPSWVIPSFLAMESTDFCFCWNILATIFKEKSWYLLHSDPFKYSERKEREKLIAHCKAYDLFLSFLFVDFVTQHLVFCYDTPPTAEMISIFDYWKMTKNSSFAHLYAFYFDRVAASYIEEINNASLNRDDDKLYHCYFQKAQKYLVKIGTLFKHLVGSSYEQRYADHLKKYREINTLLMQEKQRNAS